MKTERMTFVTTPETKAEITARAAKLRIPASELIRRAVTRYHPEDDEAVLLRLSEELETSAAATDKKLDEPLASIRVTLAQLRRGRAGRHG